MAALTAGIANSFITARIAHSKAARALIESVMINLCENRDEHFGNARLARNFFEHEQQEQANRLSSVAEPTQEELLTIEAVDVERAHNAIQHRR